MSTSLRMHLQKKIKLKEQLYIRKFKGFYFLFCLFKVVKYKREHHLFGLTNKDGNQTIVHSLLYSKQSFRRADRM